MVMMMMMMKMAVGASYLFDDLSDGVQSHHP